MPDDLSFQTTHFKLTQAGVLFCYGQWNVAGLSELKDQFDDLLNFNKLHQIDGSQIEVMDSAGAVYLFKALQKVEGQGGKVELVSFKKEHEALIQLVASEKENLEPDLSPPKTYSWLYMVGKESVAKCIHVYEFLTFFGEFCVILFKELKNPLQIQWASVCNIIEETGYRAMPITALLLFLIGIVLTYQMGLQLRDYGVNVFIVNLSGIAILREFSPLITAIIIAGRTSSSFTALISTMKVYEEIDAIVVMGLSPMHRIVLPRVIGLLIALPLLTIWSSVFGVLGSMVMANNMMEISYINFLNRFSEVVEFKEYWVGMSKTPVFALIISIIGCYQGFQGTVSADSVGRQTTRSVVQAIFLIIVADSGFSIVYSWFGI